MIVLISVQWVNLDFSLNDSHEKCTHPLMGMHGFKREGLLMSYESTIKRWRKMRQ